MLRLILSQAEYSNGLKYHPNPEIKNIEEYRKFPIYSGIKFRVPHGGKILIYEYMFDILNTNNHVPSGLWGRRVLSMPDRVDAFLYFMSTHFIQ